MKKSALILAVLFVICAAAVPTFAVDGKLYPGSMGVRWNSSDPMPSLYASAIRNPSSSKWLRLDLPVIHDIIANSIKKGWVKVVDRHYSKNIKCTLCSRYRSGTSFTGWSSAQKHTTGSSNSTKTLSFGNVGSNSKAHYYYSVHIPPTYGNNKSSVVSYYVEEK